MGNYYEVKHVQEAVALAEKFKREKRYDWFRGQVENWPLVSSLVRLNKEDLENAHDKLGRFAYWVETTAGLEAFARNADYALAVGQHYGLPTNFVDFTLDPKVAGFFASDHAPSDLRKKGCIICLDTHDLRGYDKYFLAGGNPLPEFLYLDVPNLWRLEAQQGVFLFCPYYDFESIYDFDRIVFPYTGPVLTPGHDEIYPKRKSSLEILLDQYFMKEKLFEGEKFFHMLASGSKAHVLQSDFEPKKWDQDLVINEPSILDSWSPNLLHPWLNSNQEKLLDAKSNFSLTIDIDSTKSPLDNHDNIYQQITNQINLDNRVKEKLIEWHLVLKPISRTDNTNIEQALMRLWDGLRILPYKTKDICIGLANCITIGLEFQGIEKSDHDDDWLECVSLCLGDSVEVEFGVEDGSYARGYAAKKSLLSAVRDDFSSLVNPEYRKSVIGNICGVMQAIRSPERLFDFNKLSEVFVRELAPTQVLIRRDAIFFSPARLTSFGLP